MTFSVTGPVAPVAVGVKPTENVQPLSTASVCPVQVSALTANAGRAVAIELIMAADAVLLYSANDAVFVVSTPTDPNETLDRA